MNALYNSLMDHNFSRVKYISIVIAGICSIVFLKVMMYADYLIGLGWTLVCFLAHRGPTGGLLLLQGFSGVADTQGISRCLNAL